MHGRTMCRPVGGSPAKMPSANPNAIWFGVRFDFKILRLFLIHESGNGRSIVLGF